MPLGAGLIARVQFITAAAPPPERVLADMLASGFDVTHLYGLTEPCGPVIVNDWHDAWSLLPAAQQAALKARQGARQGLRHLPLNRVDVQNPETMQPVPRDGVTMGEVMSRGNVVMTGYFRNPKDIIMSGGKNTSWIEVEEVLYRHPTEAVAAVVAMPPDTWGETPCAFVELADGHSTDAQTLRGWCRSHLAGHKVPGQFVFAQIPRTSTGEIRKFALRDTARGIKG